MNTRCTPSVRRLPLALLLYVMAVLLPASQARSAVLLPPGSDWRYFGYGYEPAPEWFASGYDDEDWDFGTAQFGYGDGDEATIVYFGPDDENKFVTTYFRTWFYMPDPGDFSSVTFKLLRDDGAVVYVNGVEVHRSNMPGGVIDPETFALTRMTIPDESDPDVFSLSTSMLHPGYNLLAVEVHQAEAASPDLSFDLEIIGNPAGAVNITRGPYLQVGSSSNIIVRWRTSVPANSLVQFGTTLGGLTSYVASAAVTTDHEIQLPGLAAATKYFYEIGTFSGRLAGDASYFFITAPVPGSVQPVRIWAIGDFGTGYPAQHNVRDAYASFTGARHTDVWLMLGDNAYGQGYDHEYQAYVFNIYPTLLRQTVVWPTMGNHETAFGSEALTDSYDYYRIFTMPTNAQAGGVASGTEHYYSYDYANVHFICLDSQTASFRQPGSAMLNWLEADLANNSRDWVIAYFHHPPYSKGSHDSDAEHFSIQMRENVVPMLENGGVDMVLVGHSHSYERSYLIDGLYDYSWNANPTNYLNHGDGRPNGTGAYIKPAGGLGERRGAVYVVDGSSGGQFGGGDLDHVAMFHSTLNAGSLVLDVDGVRLDAKFLRGDGVVEDYFTIDKSWVTNTAPSMKIARAGTNAVLTWPTSAPDYFLQDKADLDASWSAANYAISTNGRRKSVSVPASAGKRIFRLNSAPAP